ncbi:phosphate acetyltransferase [Parvularcula flava]|uniref:Phosphate acetyltransferase n=1 Tax=Aquisalinus luteolus TaxID=1566827 RepID=A0A8J3A4Q9_9PROT|nr:phosphate acetyltransferase [Aquisalinus luteolus]NHK28669.1 phosphate acetyltransferase [Aquisalinus luteolus]GGH99166.1 hypothetical protein GCM10011355_24480 [Aquisalinus luteolus]
MKIGDTAEVTRHFTTTEIDQWHALTGASCLDRHVPRPLVASLFSYLLGVHLPGPGTNYLKQEIDWIATPRLDMPITARVTVTRLRLEKNLVDLETRCTDADGSEICTGRALVYVGDLIS